MLPFNRATTGKLTIAAGVTAVLAMAVVLTGISSGSWLLGGLGDLMDLLNSALVIPLFLYLGQLVKSSNAAVGRAVQLGAVAGALLRMVGAFLIFAGWMAFDQALVLVNGGMGLMGIALVIFLLAGRKSGAARRGYYLFSLAVTLSMAIQIGGVFLYDAYAPLLQGEASLADLNPILIALLLFAPIQLLGYPLWLLWTGRLLVHSPTTFASKASQSEKSVA
jgi:hypothetical protein